MTAPADYPALTITCPTCADVLPDVGETCARGSCHGCCRDGLCEEQR
jgi:hypothetical protein